MKPNPKHGLRLFRYGAFLLLIIAATGCNGAANGQNGENESEAESESCVPVDMAEVQTRDLQRIVDGIGTLEARQRVMIRPEVGGVLESVHFEEGNTVEEGELLFSVDDDKIRHELDARQAGLEEARANLENAQLIYKRRQQLFKQELGTEEARDEARARYEALTARVKRIRAEIENIKESLADTKIRAPFDGIAGERLADPGEVIAEGTALVSMVETGQLEIAFTIPERHLAQVQKGQQVELTVSAFPEEKFSGSVYFISPHIRQDTRSLLVKAHIENDDLRLSPGGFGAVELVTATRSDRPVIPEEALVPTRTGYMVFVVKDQRAKGREVDIGLRNPGIVEITGGLEPGETIVRAGHISVNEGAKVCERKS
ncbi:MAG: efflux RND transporter periplasmic adaptor subunit [Thermodesulfobacteriota bacterium]